MANLLFKRSELLQEISSLRTLAGGFLERTSGFQLEELSSDLEGLVQNGGKIRVEIPKNRPLLTRESVGEFEPAGKSSTRRVRGVITGVWEVERKEHKVPDPDHPNKKPQSVTVIAFTGLASTVFRVIDSSSERELASWKMELGDATAPGCFFHTFASSDEDFPVPRHPNMFATPMSAIDFAIGELFQSNWEKAVSGGTDAPQRWRSIQKKRHEAFLKWQLGLVKETTSSPWCSLKLAKPKAELFLIKE